MISVFEEDFEHIMIFSSRCDKIDFWPINLSIWMKFNKFVEQKKITFTFLLTYPSLKIKKPTLCHRYSNLYNIEKKCSTKMLRLHTSNKKSWKFETSILISDSFRFIYESFKLSLNCSLKKFYVLPLMILALPTPLCQDFRGHPSPFSSIPGTNP